MTLKKFCESSLKQHATKGKPNSNQTTNQCKKRPAHLYWSIEKIVPSAPLSTSMFSNRKVFQNRASRYMLKAIRVICDINECWSNIQSFPEYKILQRTGQMVNRTISCNVKSAICARALSTSKPLQFPYHWLGKVSCNSLVTSKYHQLARSGQKAMSAERTQRFFCGDRVIMFGGGGRLIHFLQEVQLVIAYIFLCTFCGVTWNMLITKYYPGLRSHSRNVGARHFAWTEAVAQENQEPEF